MKLKTPKIAKCYFWGLKFANQYKIWTKIAKLYTPFRPSFKEAVDFGLFLYALAMIEPTPYTG